MGKMGGSYEFGFPADYYDKEFFPANGLLKDDLVGTCGLNAWANYYREFAGLPIKRIDWNVTLTGRDTISGLTQKRNFYTGGSIEFARQINLLAMILISLVLTS